MWTTLVGTTLAWLLWMFLVTSGDVGRVAVSIFLVPVVAVALGWWLLDETVGWSLVIGTVLVCAGVLLVNVTTTPRAGAGTSDETAVPAVPPEIGTHARSAGPRLTANVEP